MAVDVQTEFDQQRPEIALSWRRSYLYGLTPDDPPEPSAIPEVDRSSRLVTTARPVLEQLAHDLAGTTFCLLLADRNARIVDRCFSGPDVARQVDAIGAVVGRSFAEDSTGTNSIGTAMELRHGVSINGQEHFLDTMKRFSCYGQPILHPVTRRVEAVLEITSPGSVANPLWVPIISRAARDIDTRLRSGARLVEQRLFAAYDDACRRSRRAIVVLGDNVVLSNPAAVGLLQIADFAMLREIAAQPGRDVPWETRLELESGSPVTLRFSRIPETNGGGLFDISLLDQPGTRLSRPSRQARESQSQGDQLAAWRAERVPVLIAGEPGTGRSTVARELAGSGPLVVVDPVVLAADPAGARLVDPEVVGNALVVVDGVGQLTDGIANRVGSLLRDSGCWFAVLSSPLAPLNAPNAELASLCLRRVELQPLRYQKDDFTKIVNTMLVQLSPDRNVHLEGTTWDALRSHDWPGNHRELADVLRHALTATLSRAIRPADLPESYRRPPARHRLSQLEQVERDTIVRILRANGGNKARTAEALGIGRTTLYRRLRQLAIG